MKNTERRLIKGQKRISVASTTYSSSENSQFLNNSNYIDLKGLKIEENISKPFELKKIKQVTFSDNLVDIIEVDCWKDYNLDCSLFNSIWDKPKEEKKRKKEKNICNCIIA